MEEHNVFVRNLMVEQRGRVVGAIMGFAEREMYRFLPDEVKKAFRAKVQAAVGQYHDTVLDCLKASIDDGTVVNEEFLLLLRQVHAGQAQLDAWLREDDEAEADTDVLRTSVGGT